jgi:hypothetical protein
MTTSDRSSLAQQLKAARAVEQWRQTRVSAYSCAGDPTWQLEPLVPGRLYSAARLNWTLPYVSSFKVSRATHRQLIDAAKQFLLRMITAPATGRDWSVATLVQNGRLLQVILRWMFAEGVPSFRALDTACLDRLRAWLRERRGRTRARLSEHHVYSYMEALAVFHELREVLDDAPSVHPSPYASQRASTPRLKDIRRIPAIPDEIAVHLLSAALDYVETHSDGILVAWSIAAEFDKTGKYTIGQPSCPLRKDLARAAIVVPGGWQLRSKSDLVRAARLLRTACIILIGGLVGMRLSEILALRYGAVETRCDPLTGEASTYLVSRLFKARGARGGREERWISPAPVVRAVRVLEQLSAKLREDSGKNELFVTKSRTGRNLVLSGTRLGRLMDECVFRAS